MVPRRVRSRPAASNRVPADRSTAPRQGAPFLVTTNRTVAPLGKRMRPVPPLWTVATRSATLPDGVASTDTVTGGLLGPRVRTRDDSMIVSSGCQRSYTNEAALADVTVVVRAGAAPASSPAARTRARARTVTTSPGYGTGFRKPLTVDSTGPTDRTGRVLCPGSSE